jgi:hypothetical protein
MKKAIQGLFKAFHNYRTTIVLMGERQNATIEHDS